MRQTLNPANAADDLLLKVLTRNDAEALAVLRQHMPGTVVDVLARVLDGGVEPASLRQLGHILAGAGMIAAAGAAFKRLAEASPQSPDRAAAYGEIAALERAQGLTLAADGHLRVARRLAGDGKGGDVLPELAEGGLRVQSAFMDPARHAGMLAGLARPPLAPLPLAPLPLAEDPLRDTGFTKRLWHSAPHTEDFSFFVVDRSGRPLVLVECDVRGDLYLGCRETGIELTRLDPAADPGDDVVDLALRQLECIAVWAGCPHFWLEVPGEAPLPAPVARRAAGLAGQEIIRFRNGWIDLNQDVAAIERGYRQTTRHELRWGRENVVVASHRDPGIAIVAAYQEIHARIDRLPALTPDLLEAALAHGDISAYVGFVQGDLACMMLTSRHGLTTYDMSSLRVREAGKVPLTHILIHRAILDAKDRGQRRFHFGPLYDDGQLGAKMKNIARFKAGFASSYEKRTLLKLGG